MPKVEGLSMLIWIEWLCQNDETSMYTEWLTNLCQNRVQACTKKGLPTLCHVLLSISK